MPAKQIQSTTQEFIDIYDITNDIVIMKDGACSLILTVDALNFGLLAEEEQDAIMYSYAGLLNSLNYPVQIVIRSQTKDATNYLSLLREQELKASTDLKKSQIRAYAGFVADLIRERNVLDKKFYIIIPSNALEMGLLPPSTVVPGVKQVDVSTVERSVILDKAKTILEPKRDHLISQFNRIGLFARQLNTQEIIQLFYTSYNPEAAEGQQITNTNDYTTSLVTGQNVMTDTSSLSAVPTAAASTPVAPAMPVTPAPAVTEPVAPPAEAAYPATPAMTPAATVPSIPTGAPVPTPVSAPVSSAPVSTPVFEASAAPTAAPSAATSTTSPATPSSTDPAAELQAVINATAQQISPAPATPMASTADPTTTSDINLSNTTPLTPAASTTGDDLPPLPEI